MRDTGIGILTIYSTYYNATTIYEIYKNFDIRLCVLFRTGKVASSNYVLCNIAAVNTKPESKFCI